MAKNKHSIYTLGDVFKVGFSRWLKGWKPIHLCWLFEKYGIAVPKYFIGGANNPPELCGSRIADNLRAWEATEDNDVAAWTVGDFFCISVAFGAQSGNQSSARIVQLRWRNASDSGSFAALAATGELCWPSGDSTSLVNAAALTSGEHGCTPNTQTTWVDGQEREGSNDWTYTSLSDGDYTAGMWAIDTSNALGEKRYEFELYNVTDGAAIGTCLADLTTAASAGETYEIGCSPDAVTATSDIELKRALALYGKADTVTETSDIELKRTLSFYSKVDAATVTADISLQTSLTFIGKPTVITSTSDITITRSMALIGQPVAIYQTADITLTVYTTTIDDIVLDTGTPSADLTFYSNPSAVIAVSDIVLEVERPLYCAIQAQTSTSDISLDVARALFGKPATQFITSDILLEKTLSLKSEIASDFQTSNIAITSLMALYSQAQAQFQTSSITLTVVGSINFVSKPVCEYTTSDIDLTAIIRLYGKATGTFSTSNIDLSVSGQIEFYSKIDCEFSTYIRNKELLSNETFANWTLDDPDDWDVVEDGDASSNVTEHANGCQIIRNPDGAKIYQTTAFTTGKLYKIVVIVDAASADINFCLLIGGGNPTPTITTPGAHAFYSVAVHAYFHVQAYDPCDVIINSVSVKECSNPTLSVQRAITSKVDTAFTATDITLSVGALAIEFYSKIDCAFITSDIALLLTRELSTVVSAEFITGDISIPVIRSMFARAPPWFNTQDVTLNLLSELYGKADCVFQTANITLSVEALGTVLNTSATSITPERTFTSITADRKAESATLNRQIFNKAA